jgi:very-short-patch-repair endonuclease/DNA modification methylase
MARMKKKTENKRPIESYEHRDKERVNNPPVGLVTPETDPDAGQKKKRYAYDPHLDPQLVWAGKAEHTSFEVPTVSLHVHERIDPRTIIEAVRKRNGNGRPRQLGLFESERQEPLRDAIEFYRHKHGWTNRLIAGDSLLVMNSLLEKEGMAGKVQMIYIDPPYGIKYGSNFQPFVNKRDVKDGKDEDLTSEPEQIRAFRDTWELGIHSYLTYLRDRLLLARELLTESGSIFVQISDENVHHVRELMDEVFGVQNFCRIITFKKTTGQAAELLPSVHDYIVWYAKDRSHIKSRPLLRERPQASVEGSYTWVELPDGRERRVSRADINNPTAIERARRFMTASLMSSGASEKGSQPFDFDGETYFPAPGTHWKTHPEGLKRLAQASRLIGVGRTLAYKRYADDFPVVNLTCVWEDTLQSTFAIENVYVVQTAAKVIERCLLMTTDPGDLVFDPTCGSGTTAYVAEQWGRRWITCDTSRVALTLARQRLMTAVFDYYELAYPHPSPLPEGEGDGNDERAHPNLNPLPLGEGGRNDERAHPNLNPLPLGEGGRRPGEGMQGVWNGFRYKTVPHVTLKSIANNPEIDGIYARLHPAVEQALAHLNAALKLPSPTGRGAGGEGAGGEGYPRFKVTTGGRAGQLVDFAAPDDQTFTMPSGQVVPANELLEWEVPFAFPADWPAQARAPFDAFHAARRALQKEIDAAIARHAPQETLYDQPFVDRKKVRVSGPFTVEAVPAPAVKSVDELLPSPTGRGAGGEGAGGEGASSKPKQALDPEFLEFARQLRREQTDAERLLWSLLRDRRFMGCKFRRQHPIEPYVVDFYCHEARLAIELDGGEHNEPAARARDEERTRFLEARGIRVLRFWNNEVFNNLEGVLQTIYEALTPTLSQGEREFTAYDALTPTLSQGEREFTAYEALTPTLSQGEREFTAYDALTPTLSQGEREFTADASIARSGETLRQAEWRDELLRTGIRGKGGQYIRFARLEPLPGCRWLHAEGETRPSDEGADRVREEAPAYNPMRVVVSFGPEHAPLEQRQVQRAWEEAQQLVPKPKLLIFAAFQFDPEAAKDIDEMKPKLAGMQFLKVQMNADLLTDDLKKKRASNESFWLIGQPDVRLERIVPSPQPSPTGRGSKGEGVQYRVSVHGFDYYNTKTGGIESGGEERIAVWLLDTDYDGRSLYPRQVFFPMAGENEGWAKLARNLKAEIDEDLIEAYRGTVSLPFEPGEHKRIAVKIVDDRGIESLKVLEVE